MTYIANPVTVAHQTPKTRDEIAIRDAVRARLAIIESAIVEFVAEKTSEGFTLAEIDELYAVELPLMLGYHVDGGRVRASYDGQVVERAGQIATSFGKFVATSRRPPRVNFATRSGAG
ncbi:hypothetical protein N181_23255 [Sinorhizobium fredii USDA 205]|uniref:Uncharacterized protein n=1 Tax=Rhizobium fredii TaxID=380 RepID=A0A844A4H5_RHIFR|nr:hypothetical protein [Sinorhizobium fredii]KSV85579.1 hypothetical protein N181_23255 [Sinorhizobium fredii USDA 205]MQX06785.1 hypothetical protein [Sinorhizobium fredii]